MNKLKKIQAEITNLSFRPISEFQKTDDEAQPELYLRTSDGNIYIGDWDPCSGYFFAWMIAVGEHPQFNELPGRMYRPPVEFALL